MSERKKILVIRFSSLGDLVLTSVLYPNIKAHWPQCEITLLTKPSYTDLFAGNPHIDHVRLYDPTKQPFTKLAQELRQEQFDVVIDLHGNMRSWCVRLFTAAPITLTVEKLFWARKRLVWFKSFPPSLRRSVKDRILDCLKPLDIPIKTQETKLYPQATHRVLDTFSLPANANLIGIAPGAHHKTKQWPVENFIEAANRLGETPNAHIVIFGNQNDKPVTAQIAKSLRAPCTNLAGWTTPSELISLVSKLKLLLTNDSGLLHIAEALSIPLVAIFGPTVRWFGFAPYRSSSRVVEVTGLPCRPCTLHGDEVCPLRHHKCMKDIDVNAVLLATSMVNEKESNENIAIE